MAPLSSMLLAPALLATPSARIHSLQAAASINNANTKILHLIRHAEGTHNVEKDYKSPANLDAALTPQGEWQCREFSSRHKKNLENVECVITSPMTRTIQTAELCFKDVLSSKRRGNKVLPFIACEEWRETVNYLCDVRRPTSTLKENFPLIDFDFVEHEHDPIWAYYEARYGSQDDFRKHRESHDLDFLEKRARAALEFVKGMKEKEIGIVSHSAFYMHMFSTFAGGRVVAYGDEEAEKLMSEKFENCEIRSLVFEFL